MSNALYDAGREGFLDSSISWALGDIRVALVQAGYRFDAAHCHLADLAGLLNGHSAPLAGKTCTAGVANALPTSVIAEAAVPCAALVIYQDAGSAALSRLIAYIDDADSGLPFTPARSQHVPITWHTGPNKIFKL